MDYARKLSLAGKTALVTGAGQGIRGRLCRGSGGNWRACHAH